MFFINLDLRFHFTVQLLPTFSRYVIAAMLMDGKKTIAH